MKKLLCLGLVMASTSVFAHYDRVLCVRLMNQSAFSTREVKRDCANPKYGICRATMATAGFSKSESEDYCEDPKVGSCMAALSPQGYSDRDLEELCGY